MLTYAKVWITDVAVSVGVSFHWIVSILDSGFTAGRFISAVTIDVDAMGFPILFIN